MLSTITLSALLAGCPLHQSPEQMPTYVEGQNTLRVDVDPRYSGSVTVHPFLEASLAQTRDSLAEARAVENSSNHFVRTYTTADPNLPDPRVYSVWENNAFSITASSLKVNPEPFVSVYPLASTMEAGQVYFSVYVEGPMAKPKIELYRSLGGEGVAERDFRRFLSLDCVDERDSNPSSTPICVATFDTAPRYHPTESGPYIVYGPSVDQIISYANCLAGRFEYEREDFCK
ncbi:MAG: hypothetical protein WC846_00205 [Candidatus Gracilibacteria bacterium]|jgi:hypothetical protein